MGNANLAGGPSFALSFRCFPRTGHRTNARKAARTPEGPHAHQKTARRPRPKRRPTGPDRKTDRPLRDFILQFFGEVPGCTKVLPGNRKRKNKMFFNHIKKIAPCGRHLRGAPSAPLTAEVPPAGSDFFYVIKKHFIFPLPIPWWPRALVLTLHQTTQSTDTTKAEIFQNKYL